MTAQSDESGAHKRPDAIGGMVYHVSVLVDGRRSAQGCPEALGYVCLELFELVGIVD